MKQTAPISLDSFDPEVLAAAREVARRAGVPLESWIASVATPEPPKSTPRRRRADARPQAARPGDNADTGASPQAGDETDQKPAAPAPRKEAMPARRREASVAATAPDTAPAASIEASLGAMMRRLDALDRTISEEREASRADAARLIDEIEARLSTIRRPDTAGAMPEALVERFADIERKMGEIVGQLSAPRPLGRRGRPLASEVRDAVAEVRRRQRELEDGIAAWNASDAAGPQETAATDLAPAPEGPGRPEDGPLPSPAILELQRETSRLRQALGGLATGHDVGEIEQTMRAVATDLRRARDPQELATIAAPIELMRIQVERLAEDVADNVHARVAGDVERLAAKVDEALSSVAAGPADQTALDSVFGELDEIRRLVAALAGPERIQSLAQGVQAISAQIAQMQREAPGVAALRPLLEEIRSELKTPDESRELLGRFEAIAERIDRAEAGSVGDLIGRLETLADKVDRVSAGGSGLDALERHVLALANRLDAPRGTDPALSRLERSMGDLLAQVSALRSGSGLEAAVERATREAVTGQLKAGGGDFGLLRADLAELRDHQKTSDQRLQTTLEGVQTVLSRLSEQLDRTMMTSAAALTAAAPQDRAPGERALQERPAAPKAAGQAAGQAPARPRRAAASGDSAQAELNRLADELLEPGAGRPGSARPSPAELAPGTDIKTSFIAAARRAAQAAQTESTAEAPPVQRRDRAAPTPATDASPVSRIRGALESRRRSLLLGLAAVVLALGAYQAFLAGDGKPSTDLAATAADPRTPPAAEAEAAASRPAEEKVEGKAEGKTEPVQGGPAQGQTEPRTALPDPATTQSIAESKAPAAKAGEPGKRSLPQVAGMNALGPELAGLPPALAKLKQEALDGDAAAIWELATREAEGRGVTRDLSVAAKLYEKLAAAGFAPAQFKTGNAYEKGSGVIRDIAQAKFWYGRAADQGNVRAMHNLAVLHAENPAANGKPDFATAASAFRRAAEHGVRDSQYNLGVLYARGLGVGQDLVQSYLWFSAAAAQGDEEAGRKRDEVAAKLAPKDLTEARSLTSTFKPRTADPAANEAPPPKTAATPPMSLMGAPSPGLPNPNSFQKRVGV
ncbi:MAG TPA: hypothetical protein K8W01_10150 [Methylorubrum populi]|uniref:Localization factor PodJL n=1 Tax=Methylorubrum populi TaxID=223967 RepID=A0A921JFG7_9HYPH|nr:hypothetical protein [Methylorubrum populi]